VRERRKEKEIVRDRGTYVKKEREERDCVKAGSFNLKNNSMTLVLDKLKSWEKY
jgi:hypothetical protein